MKSPRPLKGLPTELELKYALSQNDFDLLLKKLHGQKKKAVSQVNYYFDTSQLLLRNKKIGLRIRISGGKNATVTLKFPKPQPRTGLKAFTSRFEFEERITKREAMKVIQGKKRISSLDVEPIKHLRDKLIGTSLQKIVCQGSLQNRRFNIRYRSFNFEFDKFECFNQTRFEVEIETDSPQKADKAFRELCRNYDIKYRPCVISKLARFWEARKQFG